MLVGIKRDGAPTAYEDHAVGLDWSQMHLVDGQEQTTMRPLKFPMSVGQSWTIDFKDMIRRGSQISLHVHRTYKVTGWQAVTVPAGTFHALKIESSGADEGIDIIPAHVAGGAASSPLGASTYTNAQPGGTVVIKNRAHGEFYYVPSIKNWVKGIDEQYDSQDVLVSRQARNLVAFHPGT